MSPTRYVSMGLVALTLCLSALSHANAGVWRDDFEDGNLDGWRQVWPEGEMLWKVVDGALEVDRKSGESTILITGEDSWTNYDIEFDVMLLEDFGLGDVDAMLRVVFPTVVLCGVGDFYGVPQAFMTLGDFKGAWMEDIRAGSSPNTDLKLNRRYHIKARVINLAFWLWVDDTASMKEVLYATTTDERIKNGAVGLGLASYRARFDNFVIEGGDVPDYTPPTWTDVRPVDAKGKTATVWADLKTH